LHRGVDIIFACRCVFDIDRAAIDYVPNGIAIFGTPNTVDDFEQLSENRFTKSRLFDTI